MVKGKYIDATDLINRHTPSTYMQIYDDNNTGVVNTVNDLAVQLDIDSAEGEVDSWLIPNNRMPLAALSGGDIDRLVRVAALDFAQVLGWRRHPEYVRTFGENKRAEGLWASATERMKRIQRAVQQLPDVVEQTGKKPGNVGGIVYDQGPRTTITSADGTDNGFGF